MALSQCLDDSPGPRLFKRGDDAQIKEVYNERHRLALEELVAGGLDSYLGFLKKEKIPNFLSDDEIRRITSSTVVPRCVSLHGEDAGLECSVSSSMDCSSVTYFPNVSDVEPPLLEMGWPAFTAGSFRGITRAVAHFQPSYGECIYSCKEAVRRMIKSAKEVIAVVTDSLTDLDIFRDLQEACCRRKVPVYLLLDQSCIPSFLLMCANLGVRLDELRNMRVRSITGATYFLRSGAKITGKVHERFMLVDGNRVATGSYRFNWTDGKLNSSNLIELSGQITENFDEEFRILYAQSLPINPRAPPSARGNNVCIPLLIKQPGAPQSPKVTAPEPARLSSTPKRAQDLALPLPSGVAGEKNRQDGPSSDTSTIEQDWMEQEHVRQVLALDGDSNDPAALPTCQVATQTTTIVLERATQTDPETAPSPAKTDVSSSSGSDSVPPLQTPVRLGVRLGAPPPIRRPPCDGNLRDCFRKLTKERQYHYSTIRSKLDHMVTLLSHRRELVDLTNLALSPGFRRVCKDPGRGANPAMLMDGALPSHWTRARCLQ